MSWTVIGAQPKMPRGLIILICVIALLLALAGLIELARGFGEGFSGS